MMRDLIL